MAIVVDAARAARRRRSGEVKDVTSTNAADDLFYVTRFIGALPGKLGITDDGEAQDRSLPQAFFVEQPPNGVVAPHFHEVPQFQVVVGGSGHFGKQATPPVSVHYSAGHTPYGPIKAGPDGVQYFSLRARWDPGAKPMPASRTLLKPVKRRHRLATIAPLAPADLLADDTRVDSVIVTEDDGLAAASVRLGPGRTATLELPGDGGGEYALVYAGNAHVAGEPLAVRSCLYRAPDEPPLTVTAGDTGAALLVMRFPRGTDEPDNAAQES